jgi:4'-phosphopantetheinyl transferase
MISDSVTDWLSTCEFPELRPGEIHVWCCDLDRGEDEIFAARALLSPDEVKQADRFVVERPRRSFTVCRALLRTLLGRYLRIHPCEVALEYGEFGKPELARQQRGRLSFNASHSDGWALIGVTATGRLGVDIERRRDLRDMDMLADTCFSTAELAAYNRACTADKVETFYNGWTRNVSMEPSAAPRILRIVGDATEAEQWTLFGFEPLPGYAGAIAIDQPGCEWLALDGKVMKINPG